MLYNIRRICLYRAMFVQDRFVIHVATLDDAMKTRDTINHYFLSLWQAINQNGFLSKYFYWKNKNLAWAKYNKKKRKTKERNRTRKKRISSLQDLQCFFFSSHPPSNTWCSFTTSLRQGYLSLMYLKNFGTPIVKPHFDVKINALLRIILCPQQTLRALRSSYQNQRFCLRVRISTLLRQ